jgi:hypothetical protein
MRDTPEHAGERVVVLPLPWERAGERVLRASVGLVGAELLNADGTPKAARDT